MKLALCLASLSAPVVLAQYAPAPTAYSATVTNAMMGPSVTQQIYRDGNKVVIDQTFQGSPTRSYYDLQSHANYTWKPSDASNGCSRGTFGGDWGDPFATSASMTAELTKQHPKELPPATVNGFATKVYEAADPAGAWKAKIWLDTKYGAIVKLEMTQKEAAPRLMMELKSLTVATPSAALFTLPAACGQAPAPPPASSDNMADAIMPPPSRAACSVQFKIVRAGSTTPITTGFQVALDTTVDLDHPASYKMGQGANGKVTFSGGGLHEVTAQFQNGILRIDNAPPHWDMEADFGKAGAASALIYRQCFGPQPTLLLILKNPAKTSDGADWRWLK